MYFLFFHPCWPCTKALCSTLVVLFVFQLLTHIIWLTWAIQHYGCTNPRGSYLKAVQLGFEDRYVTTTLIGGLGASQIVDKCSCHTIFKRTGMNYHSMTVQSNSLSRGAEANVSRNQERAHQKAPIWAVRYRDEQWANLSALCQNLLENHQTPLKMTFKFNILFYFFHDNHFLKMCLSFKLPSFLLCLYVT